MNKVNLTAHKTFVEARGCNRRGGGRLITRESCEIAVSCGVRPGRQDLASHIGRDTPPGKGRSNPLIRNPRAFDAQCDRAESHLLCATVLTLGASRCCRK